MDREVFTRKCCAELVPIAGSQFSVLRQLRRLSPDKTRANSPHSLLPSARGLPNCRGVERRVALTGGPLEKLLLIQTGVCFLIPTP